MRTVLGDAGLNNSFQGSFPKETSLKILRRACLKAASPETSCYPEGYDRKKSPLDGHCAAVAHVVHGTLGGDIVSGRVQGVPHYWNRLPSGEEVDLTSCQFGGDGLTPLKRGRRVRVRKLTPLRFLLFASRVLEVI